MLAHSDSLYSGKIGLELLALDQAFGANVKNKWAVWKPQHLVDLVDSNVAVFSGFSDGQSDLQMDGNLLISGNIHCFASILYDGMVSCVLWKERGRVLRFVAGEPIELLSRHSCAGPVDA